MSVTCTVTEETPVGGPRPVTAVGPGLPSLQRLTVRLRDVIVETVLVQSAMSASVVP